MLSSALLCSEKSDRFLIKIDPCHVHIYMMGRGNFACEAQEKKSVCVWVGDILLLLFVLLLLLFPQRPFLSTATERKLLVAIISTYGSEYAASGAEEAQKDISSYKDLSRFWIFLVFLPWKAKCNKSYKNIGFYISYSLKYLVHWWFIWLLYPFLF